MTIPPLLLTSPEVAELARVSTFTVDRWAREGRLQGHKLGKGWRFRREDVIAFLRIEEAK